MKHSLLNNVISFSKKKRYALYSPIIIAIILQNNSFNFSFISLMLVIFFISFKLFVKCLTIFSGNSGIFKALCSFFFASFFFFLGSRDITLFFMFIYTIVSCSFEVSMISLFIEYCKRNSSIPIIKGIIL